MKKKTLVGLGFASVILVSINALTYWNLKQHKNNFHDLINTSKVLEKLQASLYDLKDAESGQIVEELQTSKANEHHITFVSFGDAFSGVADEKLLRQIFTNLLLNAIKYSPKNSTVYFELRCFDGKAIFLVRDEGIGIPAADKVNLFKPFERGSNVGTISGTGLGLAIVKKLVDLHGGQIAVDSVVGVGTTFTVILPINSKIPALPAA